MKPLPSAMVSADYPATEGPPASRLAERAAVSQQGVMSESTMGTFKPLISFL